MSYQNELSFHFSGCGGHGFGLHSIYRSNGFVSGESVLVSVVLSHAVESWSVHHVWHHAGDSHPTHGQLQNTGASQDHVDRYTHTHTVHSQADIDGCCALTGFYINFSPNAVVILKKCKG